MVKTLVSAVTIPVASYAVFSLTIFSFDAQKYAVFITAALAVVVPMVALCVALFYLGQDRLGGQISRWYEKPRKLGDPEDARLAVEIQRKLVRQSVIHGLLVSCGIFAAILVNVIVFGPRADFDAFTSACYLALGAVVSFTNFFVTYHTSVDEMKPLLSLVLEDTGGFGFHETSSIGWRIAFLCAAVLILSLGVSWIGFTYKAQEQVRLKEMETISTAMRGAKTSLEGAVTGYENSARPPQAQRPLEASMEESRVEFFSGTGTLLLSDQNGDTKYSVGEDLPEETVQAALEVAESGGDRVSTSLIRRGSRHYLASSTHLEPDGPVLLYIRPYRPSFHPAGGMGATFLVLLLLVGATAAYLSHLLARNISGPLRQLITACRRVGRGDLSFDFRPESLDEIGELCSSYAQMLGSIRLTTGRLAETSAELTEGADHIASVAQNITASIEELNALMSELNDQLEEENRRIASIEEAIRRTSGVIHSASDRAASSLKISLEADSWAQDGKDRSRDAASKINDLKGTVEDTLRSLAELERSSELIGSIVEEIARIADQTDLLALNAAIEAARVQDHGRGFAVVAGEVKKLAEESAASARRIKDVVSEIRSRVRETRALMERSAAGLSEGAAAVQASDDSLGKLAEIVREMAINSQEISRLAELEVEESDRVEESIGGMRDFISQNLEAYREISASAEQQAQAAQLLARTAEHMAQTAHRLEDTLRSLKISPGSSPRR